MQSFLTPRFILVFIFIGVASAAISYSSIGDGMKVHSPTSDTTLTIDADGFIVDYPGLAERI